ncbi:hypothetical protein [Empedobacter tilapiae]
MKKSLLHILKAVLPIYFSLMMGITFAQKPGGTSLEVELWLKADDINLSNGAGVNQWKDHSGKERDYSKYSTYAVPTFDNVNIMNFQPSIRFAPGTSNRKLVHGGHFVSASKSYFTFYVSRVETTTSTRGVVFSFNASRGSNNGWQYGNPFMTTQSTGSTYSVGSNATPAKMAGISLATRMNNGSTFDKLYFNGSLFGTMSNARVMSTSDGFSVIGNENLSATYPFYGNIQEIIVLSSNIGSAVNTVELQKVQTYLSLKYGVELDMLTQPHQINSSGTTIWDVTSGNNISYRYNLFGLGRDDGSGLYQKQSSSYENKFATVFLGDLTNLNKENISTLDNNTFLFLGSNGLSGSSNYEYPVGTSFQNGTLSLEVNKITKTILKAQTYGKSSFIVNIRPERTATYVLISPNANFVPATTRIYLLDGNKVAKDVVVNNGDYIAYSYYLTAPGGVTDGLRVWLDPSAENIELNGTNVTAWRDLTKFENNYTLDAVSYSSKTAPQYLSCDPRMNFNPALEFNATAYLATLTGPMSTDAPLGSTSFVLYYSDPSNSSTLYTHGFGSADPRSGTTRFPAVGFDAADRQGRIRNDGSGQTNNNGTVAGFSANSTNLQMVQISKANGINGAGRIVYDFGGWQDQLSPTGLFGDAFRMARGSTLGGASLTGGSFKGLIGEVFFYEKALTLQEQDKIRSYLGMKYGLTLDENKTFPELNYQYKLSDNQTIVWEGNSVVNRYYHNNIAGLVRDDAQALNLYRSKSTTDEGVITLMTNGTIPCVTNGESFENLNGLFIGDNKGSFTPTSVAGNTAICGEIDETLTGPTGRIWLAQNTTANTNNPTPKSVRLSVGGSGFPFEGAGYEVFLLVADSEIKLKNNQWDQMVPMEYFNGVHQIDFTFYGKYKYFTFGAKMVPGSCDTCEFSGSKKLEFTSKNWIKGSLSTDYDLGDDFTAQVNVSLQAPSEWLTRNYPRASVRKSLREYRKRGNGNNVMQTEIVLSKAAAATFEIFEIDRRYVRYDDVEVYGMCGAAIIKPKLSYVAKPEKSSYTIQYNKAIANRKTSGYTSERGRVFVEFEDAVEKIYIKHKYTGGPVLGYKRIGIGPMEFTCPAPLPPPTEDGLIFTKQGSTDVLLCEEVDYTFRITNTGCDAFPVDFSDVLPAGMKWVPESLSIDETAITNAIINDYGLSNTLTIKGIEVPGGSKTFTFRARARFDETAASGNYSNRAVLTYQSKVNLGSTVTLQSCDRLTIGCSSTNTYAADSDRPQPILTSIKIDDTCYSEEEELTATLTVNNPNTQAITNSILEIGFDENFLYILNSLASSSLSLSGSGITQNFEDGLISIEGFSIPKGIHQITFKIKSPKRADMINIGQDLFPAPLTIDFALESESDDMCLGSATAYTNGEIELPFCSYCTQPSKGGVAKSSSVGISTFKDQIVGWPENVANGFLVLESYKKGMVLTRVKAADIPVNKRVEGMIVYDTEDRCIKIYNGTNWNCIQRSCNE